MAGAGGVQRLIRRVLALRPVRAFQSYTGHRGPILASGLAYSALFSVFAAVWVAFSVAGLVLAGDDQLRASFVGAVADTVPGLISTGGASGAIDPDDLLQSPTFSWTGIVALLGGLLTALGFLSSARDAIREMFSLPPPRVNGVLLKLRDLALLVGFAVVVIVSTGVTVLGTGATGALLSLVGIPSDSDLGYVAGRVVSIAVALALDSLVVGVLLTLHSGIRIPRRQLVPGALIGGAGAALLTVLFQLGVLGGAGANPLLGSFVVIIGLLIYFNVLCQALLIAASFVAVSLADRGISVVPKDAERMPRHARPALQRPRVRRER
ncbi:YhjD/YihY/BrkB family envelope integrity protein [Galbitalea sp. SE-J8]|uniref:YihY/virulence factor BrkB family protein n=1 Tax=Galbitalea sp. SE-J8 TaxID=3054952 RepID=UPI00259CCFC4|nr:YhjD/YihY/BrkB family envelope integrity protein [Galbitalea sp. SE-J8]MDM4763638.1 YhjD/YihY/BrkB family envelope integrity protein [Galbitalea sp. SE-J8]